MLKRLLPLCVSLAFAASPAFAAYQAQRVAAGESIKLDGKLDEAVWQKAVIHDTFYQNAPVDKLPAHVKTEVKVAFDERYYYVAVKSFDPNPDQIRAPFGRRDKVSGDQDFIGVFIDTAGARKSALEIYVNPRGVITDGIFTDANGDDFSFDFDFDVATSRFEGGWIAEIRIPFTSLPYVAGQTKPWNMLVFRNMTRDTRYKMFSGNVTRETNCLLCFADPVEGLKDLPTGLNWTATPQFAARSGREDVAGQPRRSYSGKDFSLDFKVRPNSASTIDGTINPDFSQVELDAPQLSGNTRFGLFVQEKRPFFLEGSDIFQTPFRAIYTRSITDPAWGARYTRRDADSDVTVLTVKDGGGGLVQLPTPYYTDFANQNFASQATVARANFKLGKLAVGGVLTDRTMEKGGGYNRVAGPDFYWQIDDTTRLKGQLLLSNTSAQSDGKGGLKAGPLARGHASEMDYYTEGADWGIFLGGEEVSDGFRADNGFFSQVGYTNYTTELTRKFHKQGILNEFNFYLHLERKFDRNGNVIYDDYTPGLWMTGPYDTQLNLRVRPRNRTRVKDGGPLFQTETVWAGFNITPGKMWSRASIEGEFGDVIDVEGGRLGKGGNLSLNSRFRPFDNVELEPNYSRSWIDGKNGVASGQRLYTEQLFALNGIVHFGPRDNLRMILQKTSTRRNPALYAIPVAAETNSTTSSFVYGHTAGLGTAAYVGLTLTKGETPGIDPKRTQNEFFVKLSWQI